MDGVRAMEGAAVGTALGDALGLPREGLSPGVARALYGLPVEHAFWGSRGVGSDDTEHTVLTLRALARCEGDPELFGRLLAAELRWWLGIYLSLPTLDETTSWTQPTRLRHYSPRIRAVALGLCLF